MDVADTASKGDGSIGTDRVALEKMIADGVLIPAGGPDSPMSPFCTAPSLKPALASKPAPTDPHVIRSLRIGSVVGIGSSAIDVPVEADLAGDEVIAQFTVHFDPSLLSISDAAGVNSNPDVLAGDLPEGAHVIVNTSQLADGNIGILININGTGAYPAVTAPSGTRSLVVLRFHLRGPVAVGEASPLAFTDTVFTTKASDSVAQTLPITGGLRSGSIIIVPNDTKIRTRSQNTLACGLSMLWLGCSDPTPLW